MEGLVRAWHQKIVDYAAHAPKVRGYGRMNDNPQDNVTRDAEDWVKVAQYFCPDLLTQPDGSEHQSTIDSTEPRTPHTPGSDSLNSPAPSTAASRNIFPPTSGSNQPGPSGDTGTTF